MATGHFVLELLVTQGGQKPGQIIVELWVILLVIRSWQLTMVGNCRLRMTQLKLLDLTFNSLLSLHNRESVRKLNWLHLGKPTSLWEKKSWQHSNMILKCSFVPNEKVSCKEKKYSDSCKQCETVWNSELISLPPSWFPKFNCFFLRDPLS